MAAKRRIRRRESRCEDRESLVGIAEVSDHEVREDCARGVDCGRVRFIVGVPLILELRQSFGRFWCPKREVLFGIVWLIV